MVHRAGVLPKGCRSCRGMDVVLALWSPSSHLSQDCLSLLVKTLRERQTGMGEAVLGTVAKLGPRPLQPRGCIHPTGELFSLLLGFGGVGGALRPVRPGP